MPTPDFGLCLNQDCVLSYCKMPRGLDDQIQKIDAREKRNEDTSDLTAPMKEFYAPFFQFNEECSKCSTALYRVTERGPEFEGLNKLLDAGARLRAKGLLSHP
jgi:hypothetical protein